MAEWTKHYSELHKTLADSNALPKQQPLTARQIGAKIAEKVPLVLAQQQEPSQLELENTFPGELEARCAKAEQQVVQCSKEMAALRVRAARAETALEEAKARISSLQQGMHDSSESFRLVQHACNQCLSCK